MNLNFGPSAFECNLQEPGAATTFSFSSLSLLNSDPAFSKLGALPRLQIKCWRLLLLKWSPPSFSYRKAALAPQIIESPALAVGGGLPHTYAGNFL